MDRFVCIHGHFYQPPRENPWTGEIERQPSAGADHDWNARIARECYDPNGAARVLNAKGELADLVNNYALMSFDFGPTLLTWYEKARPEGYRRLIEADRESAKRLNGHGNAIAHGYNHMILPLAGPRDLRTQVRWGLEDFRFRFSREPESLWLPETAVNADVLRALIDHGLKYVILAPGQAESVRPMEASAEEAVDVSGGTIDTRRPYRWFDREAEKPGRRKDSRRHIDVFFYEGGVSHAVAFERLMAESGGAADRLEGAFDRGGRSPQLVSAATDGESYGHHQHFAEMGLAHLLKHELDRRGVDAVNYGWFLERCPPTHEVVLKEGPQKLGTSWSCAHGVARWMDECGCGSEGRRQLWRRPMREALEWLSARLASHFELKGEALLKDPWAARDEYITVLLDPSRVDAFLDKHAKVRDGEAIRRLLEMQKYAMYMFTSCGWFFSEISGIEAVQNLKYAARAIELSGARLEAEFLSRLERAPSNVSELQDGRGVYEKLVRPSMLSEKSLSRRSELAAELDRAAAALASAERPPLDEAAEAAALGIDVPAPLKASLEDSLGIWLWALGRAMRRSFEARRLGELEAALKKAKTAGLSCPLEASEPEWEAVFLARIDARDKELGRLAALLGEAGLRRWKESGQIRFFAARGEWKDREDAARLARILGISAEAVLAAKEAEA